MSDTTTDDEDLERRCAALFPARSGKGTRTFKGPHATHTVRLAAELVDESGIVEKIVAWRREDNPGFGTRGGRPAMFGDRHALILLMLHAITDEPLLISELADTVQDRLNLKSRAILDLPPTPAGTSHRHLYTNLRRAIRRFLLVIDSAPFHSGKRLSFSQVQEIHRRRVDVADRLAQRHQRASWVANQLLHVTYQLVSADVRSRWKGTICVDGTAVPVWGAAGTPRAAERNPAATCSPESDAGWHVREAEDHADRDGRKRKGTYAWAYEATIAVMADDPDITGDFPKLALAVSLEKPAGRVAENAMVCVGEIVDRGLPINYFVGDRAYLPNAKIEKLQGPLTILGYKLVADYNRNQLGIQAQHAGAIMVEGAWYCPSMPEAVINASVDHRDGKISDPVYRERIDARRPYQLQAKTKADHNGVVHARCPAAGPSPTLDCPLKPKGGKLDLGIPKLRAQVFHPPEHPDKICANRASVAFGPETGLKFGQAVPYRSKEWHKLYDTPRNTVEGGNGIVKDDAKAALASPGRRRARGYTLQLIYTACLLAATNLHRINSFHAQKPTPTTNPAQPLQPDKRRRHRTLGTYRRNPNAPPLVGPAAEAAAT